MDQVQEVKKKIDIVSLISTYLPLKKAGRRFKANCPFHQEKTPSFVVSPELQIYKCFGCGASGDVFTFLQEFEKLTFAEALEILAQQAGVKLEKSFRRPEDIKKSRILEINQRVARFYHYCLTKHKTGHQALDYLHSRGIKDSTITEFQLGFSPSSDNSLANYLTKKLTYKPQELITSGTFLESSYQKKGLYDRFSGRLVFPIIDHRNQTIAFSGRLLPTDQRKNTGKYINSPETPAYHKSDSVFGLNLAKEAIKKEDQIIVVEGELDMISPYQAGIKNIIAIKGTAFTQGQLELLGRFSKNLILALDSDTAGAEATKKSILLADSLSFDMKVLNLKDYKDPDEAVRADLPFFKTRLQKAIPVWDFFINTALSTYSSQTIYGKRQILSATLPYLTRLENQVLKDVYLTKLANYLGVSKESVQKESQKAQTGSATTPFVPTPPPAPSSAQTHRDMLEDYLLLLLLRSKKPHLVLKKDPSFSQIFKITRNLAIVKKLEKIKEFVPASFADSLPAEIKPSFEKAYLKALELDLSSKTRFKEIKKTQNSIKSIDLKSTINRLSKSMAQSEAKRQKKGTQKIEKEILNLTKELSQIQSQD
jgi:DNA primase